MNRASKFGPDSVALIRNPLNGGRRNRNQLTIVCPAGGGAEYHRQTGPSPSDMGGSFGKAGHGGGDFWTSFHFANAIRTGEQPYLDVYRGVTMSSAK